MTPQARATRRRGKGRKWTAGLKRGPQHLGHRDSAHDRAEHLVLRRAGWHLHACDRWGASAHGHRVPRPHAWRGASPDPAETPVSSQPSRECSQRRLSSQSGTAEARLRPGLCRMAVRDRAAMTSEVKSAVDLYWLPLGAGGHSVRLNGKAFEYVVARVHHRDACALYHSALVVEVPEGRFVIEQAPVRDRKGSERGVVAEGPVGSRWARSLRIFRYEIRRWRDGVIPDVDEAVESPRRLTQDVVLGRRLLELVPQVPTPVWGATNSRQARCGTRTR